MTEIKEADIAVLRAQFEYIQKALDDLKELIEKQNGRLRTVEQEQAKQGVYSGIISTLVGGVIGGISGFLFGKQ